MTFLFFINLNVQIMSCCDILCLSCFAFERICMLAVFVNMGMVLLGSMLGLLFGKRLRRQTMQGILSSLALITMVIGITSAIQTTDTLCLIVCSVLGTALGVWLKLEQRINNTGDWIKNKLGAAGRFTEGFVSACILFCVGSMTILGSFEAGLYHNYSIIFTKSALDFVSAMLFSSAMGIGVAFSSVFILLFQGALTLFAQTLAPFLSEEVVRQMSAVGGTILIGMGINMLEISKVKIPSANMLPAIFLPIFYIPLIKFLSSLFS